MTPAEARALAALVDALALVTKTLGEITCGDEGCGIAVGCDDEDYRAEVNDRIGADCDQCREWREVYAAGEAALDAARALAAEPVAQTGCEVCAAYQHERDAALNENERLRAMLAERCGCAQPNPLRHMDGVWRCNACGLPVEHPAPQQAPAQPYATGLYHDRGGVPASGRLLGSVPMQAPQAPAQACAECRDCDCAYYGEQDPGGDDDGWTACVCGHSVEEHPRRQACEATEPCPAHRREP